MNHAPSGTDSYRVFLSVKERRELLPLVANHHMQPFPEWTRLSEGPESDPSIEENTCG